MPTPAASGCQAGAPARRRRSVEGDPDPLQRADPRQRHAPLDAALHLDESQLHVDGGGQFRLGLWGRGCPAVSAPIAQRIEQLPPKQ